MTTFLAGFTCNVIVAPFVVDQPMNRSIFTQYLRQYLLPELAPSNVVILDNLSSHKSAEAAALIGPPAPRSYYCRPTCLT